MVFNFGAPVFEHFDTHSRKCADGHTHIPDTGMCVYSINGELPSAPSAPSALQEPQVPPAPQEQLLSEAPEELEAPEAPQLPPMPQSSQNKRKPCPKGTKRHIDGISCVVEDNSDEYIGNEENGGYGENAEYEETSDELGETSDELGETVDESVDETVDESVEEQVVEDSELGDGDGDGDGERFTNYTEHFQSNNNSVLAKCLNVNLLLKAVLFACLFYILAHDDSRKMILKYVNVGSKNYLYVASVLYFVVYMLLNMLV